MLPARKNGAKNLSSMLCHEESQMWYYTESIFIFVKVQTPAWLKRAFSPAAAFISSVPGLYPRNTSGQKVTPQQKYKGKCKLETTVLSTNSTDHAYGCSLGINGGTACHSSWYSAVITHTSLKMLHVWFTTDTCFPRSDPKPRDFAVCVTDPHPLEFLVGLEN